MSKAVGDYLLAFIDGKSGFLFQTKKGTPLRAGNYADVGWMSGSMITAFTASADSASRIWRRCGRMDT